VTNHGPDAVTGALVGDPASAGRDCTAVPCAGAAGPGSVAVAGLSCWSGFFIMAPRFRGAEGTKKPRIRCRCGVLRVFFRFF
jgi:hypothetical protein